MTNIRRLITLIVLFAVLAGMAGAGWYFWVRPAGSLEAAWNSLVNPSATIVPGTLSYSGTVETTMLSIAAEQPGKVLEVDFQEGDAVKAGAVLVHLDDGTLKIQRDQAADNLEMAQLNLLKLTSPMAIANLQKTIAQDKQSVLDAQQTIDNHTYFVNDAGAVQSAQSALYVAENALDRAKKAYDKINGDPATDVNKAAAYQQYYLAERAYENASNVYALWTGIPNLEQNDLRITNLALANAKLAEDQTLLGVLSGGSIPDHATGAGIAQLQQARITVQVGQAKLKLLDDQIAKTTITAPVDGVVMTRSVDPGNVVNPGVELLSLARLNDLTITIYIPEDTYRKIKVGQAAVVTVDSFPGQTFSAAVLHISDQPEFTPRTSQTVSAAESTVYAIQLELNDATGTLKPGMPADVSFFLK